MLLHELLHETSVKMRRPVSLAIHHAGRGGTPSSMPTTSSVLVGPSHTSAHGPVGRTIDSSAAEDDDAAMTAAAMSGVPAAFGGASVAFGGAGGGGAGAGFSPFGSGDALGSGGGATSGGGAGAGGVLPPVAGDDEHGATVRQKNATFWAI